MNKVVGLFLFLAWGLSFCALHKNRYILPDHFPEPVYRLSGNPGKEETIQLGRMLFYDPILSADNTISCASCHASFNSFAHTDHALSHGIGDSIGTRNAPALMNLAWQPLFMWDGAVNHLDVQALAPISHPKEMGETIESVVKKVNDRQLYRNAFYDAYGDSTVTGERLLKALAQFQLSLVSANSKYDRVKKGKEQFTDQEEKGYQLFLAHCNRCHTEPLFSNYSFANNGLPQDPELMDVGRYAVTGIATDSLLFKIPSLRNLSYTYPYMHDGRFLRLSQVLQHYGSSIADRPTVDPELKGGLPLTETDRVDLIAFLLTLNDDEFVFNPDLGFPKEILLQTEGNEK